MKNNILKYIKENKNIIITAHGNSLRALCKKLFNISNYKINTLEIPTGNPMLIELDKNLNINNSYYLDESRSQKIVNNE